LRRAIVELRDKDGWARLHDVVERIQQIDSSFKFTVLLPYFDHFEIKRDNENNIFLKIK